MKTYSTPLVMREMQIYHNQSYRHRMVKVKQAASNNCLQGCEKQNFNILLIGIPNSTPTLHNTLPFSCKVQNTLTI